MNTTSRSLLPPPWLAWTAAGLVLATVLAPAAVSASASSARARAARVGLAAVEADGRSILEARRVLPTQSSEGLAEAAMAALAAAGIDQSAMDSLSPDASFEGNGSAALQRATLSLRCTLPQLGRLLDAWPRFAPGWTISAGDLSPAEVRGRPQVPTTSGPLPLRVVLTLEGVFAPEGNL